MLPAIPFDKHFLDTVIRQVTFQNFSENTHAYQALGPKQLLSGAYRKLRDVFSQVRIRSVDAYVIPGIEVSMRGFHLVHLGPKSEFWYNDSLDYQLAASWPGSKVGRIYESLSTSWYPTDSNEKVWFSTSAGAPIIDCFYISACQPVDEDNRREFDIQLVLDCHVTLRGLQRGALRQVCDSCGECMDEGDLAT